ncbi:hypothetical protein [Flavobacterium jejuense]|nr:hypothetical protein [Flavobacterium jejuense]
MKKIILFLSVILPFSCLFSQVGIGKTVIEGDGILDFQEGTLKGIVLPWVTSAAAVTSPVGGTLIYDTNDQRVKYYNGTAWIDLSGKSGTVDTSSQDLLTDVGNGIVIGINPSTASGVLVLESSDKALILPKVDNAYANIPSPEPGTIVYDPVSKTVQIYNGQQWSFWGEK